jgi:hypothetical protein
LVACLIAYIYEELNIWFFDRYSSAILRRGSPNSRIFFAKGLGYMNFSGLSMHFIYFDLPILSNAFNSIKYVAGEKMGVT